MLFVTYDIAHYPSSGVHSLIDISCLIVFDAFYKHDDIIVAVYPYTENSTFFLQYVILNLQT